MKHVHVAALAFLFCLAASESRALAQAWVDVKGSLSASSSYTFSSSDRIVYESGYDGLEDIQLTNHIVQFGATYVPIERLAVDISLPLMSVRHDRDGTFVPLGRYDDGNFHTTLEDFRANVRYQLPIDALTITPTAGVRIPVTDYEVNGNAGVARGLVTGGIGVHIGKYFLEGIPDLFLMGSYVYNIAPKFETDWPETSQHSQNFSEANLFVGYFINTKLEVHAAFNSRLSHGGIAFAEFPMLSPAERAFYNAILKEKFVYGGLGASYSLTDTISLSAQGAMFVWGENTTNQKVLGLGVEWQVL